VSNNSLFDTLGRLPISRSGDRAPRCPIAVWVALRTGEHEKSARGQAVNISRSGLLVRYWGMVPTAWQVGDELLLEIEPDSRFFAEQLNCRATIARLLVDVDAPEHRMMIGFRFNTR